VVVVAAAAVAVAAHSSRVNILSNFRFGRRNSIHQSLFASARCFNKKRRRKVTTRNILILLTVLIAMCLCAKTVFAETITTKDYFVLCDRTMAFTGTNQVVTTESAASQCNLISEPVFGVNYPGYPHRFFNYDSEGNLMFYGAYFGSEYIYIPPSGGVQWLPSELEIGSTYTSTWNRDEYAYLGCGYSGVGSDSLSITVTGPETVTVPAGTFVTYKLVYVDDWRTSSGLTGQSVFTYWLAKNVGWVKMILGGVTYELMSYEGPPPAPHLSVTTSGITVSLSWSAQVNAEGYTLFYAPYPYTGPETIVSVEMGTQTGISVNLWEGASFYVAIQAYNSFGNSGYSNIGYFVIDPLPATYTNSLGQTFVLLPAGTFTMGSPTEELGRESDEEPQHQVTLSQPFYMQQTEVTQAQWEAVMGSNPSYISGCPTCPVETVSWYDVQAYVVEMNKLSEGTYSLPTEAQWEYAARAGSTTAFYNGGITELLCGYDPNLDAIGWYCYNTQYPQPDSATHPVAGKAPNAWGLYDMSGNVWEWCQDWYGSYSSSAVTDPVGPSSGSARVFRGGSWTNYATRCRSANRCGEDTPDIRHFAVGLRLLRQP